MRDLHWATKFIPGFLGRLYESCIFQSKSQTRSGYVRQNENTECYAIQFKNCRPSILAVERKQQKLIWQETY